MEIANKTLLTIEESVALSGVQVETIKQYQDLGLLRVSNIQGQDFFEEEDIKLIFNYKPKQSTNLTNKRKEVIESSEFEYNSQDLPTLTSILNSDPTHSEQISKTHVSLAQNTIKAEKIIPFKTKATSLAEDVNTIQNIDTTEVKLESDAPDIIGEPDYSKQNNSHFAEEKHGLSSIDILNLTRSLKSQLELVKSERDWLRTRVEKLELQIERQQAISMSESDTLKTLALLNLDQKKLLEEKTNSKKSPFDFLLSWTRKY